MKAAVLKKPGQLCVMDIPRPFCDRDEVIVKVGACGICGSDLRYYVGENPWAQHTLGRYEVSPANMVLGHEFAGIVEEVGNDSLKHMIGKRVAVEPYNTCGMCDMCRTGRYNLCKKTLHIGHGAGWGKMDFYPGGMAEYCNVWATHVYEIPDALSFESAVILDPLAVAIHAIRISGFKPLDDILIMGTGPVGLCILQVAKAFGAGKVYCVDLNQKRLSAAKGLKADHVIDAREEDVLEVVAQVSDNRGVDVVFDMVGSKHSQQQSLDVLSNSGKLINLVASNINSEYNLLQLSAERSIKGSSNNLYEDFVSAIDLMTSKKVLSDLMITHKLSIDNVMQGFDLLKDSENSGAIKVVILPGE